jgi:hypothetical protein
MSRHLFDLKTDVSELSSANAGFSRLTHEEVAPDRTVAGTNFANGKINIKWSTDCQKWWIPNRSYVRIRGRFVKSLTGVGTPLTMADGIAPSMGLCANLFQVVEHKIAGTSTMIIDDNQGQLDTLNNRQTKPKAWVDSIGAATNFMEADFVTRQARICNNGTKPPILGDVVTTSASLGLNAADTFTYTEATQLLAFTAGTAAAIPDLTLLFDVGDSIRLAAFGTLNAAGGDYKIARVNAASMVLVDSIGADIGPAVVVFSRVRHGADVAGANAGNFECLWQPSLSIFKIDHALPCAAHTLSLTPRSSNTFKKYAIESLTDKTPGTDYDFEITDLYLYAAVVEGPRVDNMSYLLDLDKVSCQSQKIDSVSFSFKPFTVSPSTTALTVAYQDLRHGDDTSISATRFKTYPDVIDLNAPTELNISRLVVKYAGQSVPSYDTNTSFVAGTDHTVQRYYDTQINNGLFMSPGGAETLDEYHTRGSYYHFLWARDGSDRSTMVKVWQSFTALTPVTNMHVLLFEHSKQMARVQITDGSVTQVDLVDR